MSVIKQLPVIILLALLLSLQSCSAQGQTTDNIAATSGTFGAAQADVSLYSQYYKMTGEAAPTTPLTAPKEYALRDISKRQTGLE